MERSGMEAAALFGSRKTVSLKVRASTFRRQCCKRGLHVVDPNSMLRLEAAAAHELAQYHRWHDMSEFQRNDDLLG
jgi:hypothetical protein